MRFEWKLGVAAIIAHMDAVTTNIRDEGVGVFYLPSRAIFERITPNSEPMEFVFTDGSFLVVKEIFEYGFPNESATEPDIYFHEYGYHYQRPEDQTFFRYDYHPTVGSSETHPLYHLHASGWKEGATDLPQVPRFPVSPMTLDEVLELIRVNFFL
jgi:hypothetical protein